MRAKGARCDASAAAAACCLPHGARARRARPRTLPLRRAPAPIRAAQPAAAAPAARAGPRVPRLRAGPDGRAERAGRALRAGPVAGEQRAAQSVSGGAAVSALRHRSAFRWARSARGAPVRVCTRLSRLHPARVPNCITSPAAGRRQAGLKPSQRALLGLPPTPPPKCVAKPLSPHLPCGAGLSPPTVLSRARLWVLPCLHRDGRQPPHRCGPHA
jgi:hypothetical protein